MCLSITRQKILVVGLRTCVSCSLDSAVEVRPALGADALLYELENQAGELNRVWD